MQHVMDATAARLSPHHENTPIEADEVLDEARSTEIGRISVMDAVRFLVVSLYLLLVLLLLLVTRRIGIGFTLRGLVRRLRSRFRRPSLGIRDLPHNAALPR